MLFIVLAPYIGFCIWLAMRGINTCKGFTGKPFCFCITDLWIAVVGLTPSIGIGACILSAMLGYDTPPFLIDSWERGLAPFWVAVWMGVTAGCVTGTIVGRITSIEWEPFETRPSLVSAARTLTGSLLGFLSFVLYYLPALVVAALRK